MDQMLFIGTLEKLLLVLLCMANKCELSSSQNFHRPLSYMIKAEMEAYWFKIFDDMIWIYKCFPSNTKLLLYNFPLITNLPLSQQTHTQAIWSRLPRYGICNDSLFLFLSTWPYRVGIFINLVFWSALSILFQCQGILGTGVSNASKWCTDEAGLKRGKTDAW